jgi:hypothetical protein
MRLVVPDSEETERALRRSPITVDDGASLIPVDVEVFARLPLNGRTSRAGKIVEAFLESGEPVVQLKSDKKAGNQKTAIEHYLKSRGLREVVLTRVCDGTLYLALADHVQEWNGQRSRSHLTTVGQSDALVAVVPFRSANRYVGWGRVPHDSDEEDGAWRQERRRESSELCH